LIITPLKEKEEKKKLSLLLQNHHLTNHPLDPLTAAERLRAYAAATALVAAGLAAASALNGPAHTECQGNGGGNGNGSGNSEVCEYLLRACLADDSSSVRKVRAVWFELDTSFRLGEKSPLEDSLSV
jgi:hypothetical protein